MQFFGEYATKFNEEFLVESYLYFKKDGQEDISVDEFKQLIKTQKDKKKNIAGTIFMYNPFYYPIGYDNHQTLTKQNFDFDSGFHQLQIEKEIALFRACIKGYEGQLVQIRTLFNLNINNIDKPELLLRLDNDLERLNTKQLTIFDRESNYLDINNLQIYGKFVLLAWGHKINPVEFINIYAYAKHVYDKCVQMQKKIAFAYKKSAQINHAIENYYFLHPMDGNKLQSRMRQTLEEIFSTKPPMPCAFNDIK